MMSVQEIWLKLEIKSSRVREITNYNTAIRRFPNVKKHEMMPATASGKFFHLNYELVLTIVLVVQQLITIPLPF